MGVSEMPTKETDKINGFDKYEITDAVDTLIREVRIKQDKRKGFYKTVKQELTKKVAAAEQALLETKTAVELNRVFKDG